MTENELLEALRAAMMGPARDEDAITTEALAEALGVSTSTVQRKLRPLIRSGRIECVRKTITDIAGRAQTAPAYRMAA